MFKRVEQGRASHLVRWDFETRGFGGLGIGNLKACDHLSSLNASVAVVLAQLAPFLGFRPLLLIKETRDTVGFLFFSLLGSFNVLLGKGIPLVS